MARESSDTMTRLTLRPIYLLVLVAVLVLYRLVSRGPLHNTVSSASTQQYLPSIWRLDQPESQKSVPAFIPSKPAASFVILCRNSDLGDLLPSLANLEQTFNAHQYNSYPYIFLNNDEFTPYFKGELENILASFRLRFGGPNAPAPEIRWGLIPQEHWKPPEWIDWEKAHRNWDIYSQQKISYARSQTYRSMCRWQSGFFFKHPLLSDLEYYWRVEPSTRFTCNLVPPSGQQPRSWDTHADGNGDFWDPFRWMKVNNKKYGFTLTMKEHYPTIRTLWPKARSECVIQ